jgi:MSHA biogenesis protein MshO
LNFQTGRVLKVIPMQQPSARKYAQHGFTLVEMIVVMVIVGILAALGGMFIARPIEGFLDLSRRATLVDAADNALRRMQRDIRQALPNSVRITPNGRCLELLHTVDGGRYRAEGPGNVLDFTTIDSDGFDVLGTLDAAPAAGQSLVVYNLASAGLQGNAYSGDNLTGIDTNTSTATFIQPDPPIRFPFASPFQRFFLVDGPISYVFNAGAGTLERHAGYAIAAAQSASPTNSPAVMARHVTGCVFRYDPGTPWRAGLVTMQLTLADAGETITLLHQVHVENAP